MQPRRIRFVRNGVPRPGRPAREDEAGNLLANAVALHRRVCVNDNETDTSNWAQVIVDAVFEYGGGELHLPLRESLLHGRNHS